MSFTSTTGTHVFIQAVDSLAATRFDTTSSTGTLIAFGYQLEVGDIATAYIPTTTAAVSVGPVSNVPRLDYLGSTCPRLLLEPQRTNLALFSEQFDNAAWTKGDLTVSANNATSPDGFTNADRMVETTATGQHLAFQSLTVANGSTYTFTIFLKAQQRNAVSLQLADDSNRFTTLFDVSAGTILTTRNTGTPVGTSNSIVNYGNGWYRCSITMTQSAGTTMIPHFALSNSNTPTWDGFDFPTYAGNTANGLLAYGAALELGAYATSYIPTLAASVTRVADAASKTGISSLIGQTEGTLFMEIDFDNIDKGPQQLMELHQDANNRFGLAIFYDSFANTNPIQIYQFYAGGLEVNIQTIPNTGKVKAAVGYKSNDWVFYVNGQQIGTDTSASVPTTSTLYLGYNGSTYQIGNGINQALLFKTRLTNAQIQELTSL
jgi:hypothetical protein